ncbi:MAG: hypothetical protein HY747_12705, partial [Elusimicrobia bacterium]|nr:hypothetical protein [Elusimicrobiota bacterium]
ASRNGYSVAEMAPLFDGRLDRQAYEQLVRRAPWLFGVYEDQAYLEGRIPVSETLAAGAGAGLWLMRKALLDETRKPGGFPDGGLILLPAIPSDWLNEGRVIILKGMPTAYGTVSLEVRSFLATRHEIFVDFSLDEASRAPGEPLRKLAIRLVTPDRRQPRVSAPDVLTDAYTIVLPPASRVRRVVRF